MIHCCDAAINYCYPQVRSLARAQQGDARHLGTVLLGNILTFVVHTPSCTKHANKRNQHFFDLVFPPQGC